MHQPAFLMVNERKKTADRPTAPRQAHLCRTPCSSCNHWCLSGMLAAKARDVAGARLKAASSAQQLSCNCRNAGPPANRHCRLPSCNSRCSHLCRQQRASATRQIWSNATELETAGEDTAGNSCRTHAHCIWVVPGAAMPKLMPSQRLEAWTDLLAVLASGASCDSICCSDSVMSLASNVTKATQPSTALLAAPAFKLWLSWLMVRSCCNC